MTTIFEKSWLPARPYATNDFTQGLRRTSHDAGLDYKFVETNPRTYKNIITLDVDSEEAEAKVKTLVYDDQKAPEPSWMTFNPYTGHAHLGFVLGAPVGTQRGLAYFDDVRSRLALLFGADVAYRGFTTRNPLHQPTTWGEETYTLKELDAFTAPLKGVKILPPKEGEVINGRNDLIFSSLRKYAYIAYRRLNWDADALLGELEAKALELYFSEIEDHSGFPISEVKSIVRSVWKWTTKNHTKEAFAKIQSERSRKRWGTHTQDNDAFILMLKGEMGFTFQDMADHLGISPAGAKSAYYRAKKRSK